MSARARGDTGEGCVAVADCRASARDRSAKESVMHGDSAIVSPEAFVAADLVGGDDSIGLSD